MALNLNLVIAFLALTVILANINRIEMAPTWSQDNYLTRAWGESSVPFTVIYSNYARNQQKNTPKTTTTTTTRKPPVPSTTQKRRPNTTTTKRPQIPNLFVSNGWGPLG